MDRREIIQNIFENMGAMRRNLAGQNKGRGSRCLPTHAQIGILFAIFRDGPQSVKNISAKFVMTSSAATQLVNGLEKDGLLTRKIDKADRRKTRLELTAKGRKNIDSIRKQRHETMSKILGVLNTGELLQLKRIQDKIVERIKYYGTK